MTAIHVICALITLGYWVWAQRKEYLEHQYLQIELGTILVIVLLMLAGLWGLLLTIVAVKKENSVPALDSSYQPHSQGSQVHAIPSRGIPHSRIPEPWKASPCHSPCGNYL